MFSFLIMRYSVYTPTGGAYVTARRVGLDRYKDVLFSPERMRMRAHLFDHVTLHSLIAQKPALSADNTRLLVFTSDQLPETDRARLDALVAPHAWIEVIAVPDGAVLRHRLIETIQKTLTARFPGERSVPYATLRLDDDDALSFDFLARVRRFIAAPYVGMCVSFGRGYAGWVDEDGRFTHFREMVYPNLALGLAYIGSFDTVRSKFLARYRTIMGLMRHTRVHMKAPTILACKTPSYIRTLYSGQDSRSLKEARYYDGQVATPGQISKRVPISPAMLSAYDPDVEKSVAGRSVRDLPHFPRAGAG